MPFAPGSRSLLTRRDLGRFPGETLFDRVARAVCEASCLPRKELYESWEVARRVRRRVRGRPVVELAAGHALVAHLLLLLDDSSEGAVAVDPKSVPSAARLQEVLVGRWPRLSGRVERRLDDLGTVPISEEDLVVSVHACGALSDLVLDRAMTARAPVALLPCCHDARTCDTGGLLGFLPVPLAVDATRVARLRAAGYEVSTQTIPAEITPHNRLIVALPKSDLESRAQ
ncbi:MAG TPA: methyltransferase domain-containing protein [Vicinamibacteria bacterium]|nr:methyltransferase domain-containing protein [Vicinamibacteria bacterium]